MGRKRAGGTGVATGAGETAHALHGGGGIHDLAAIPDGSRSGPDAAGLLDAQPESDRAAENALIAFLTEKLTYWTEERRSMNPAARYYVDAFRQVRVFVAGE
jgi:hypothetical protein